MAQRAPPQPGAVPEVVEPVRDDVPDRAGRHVGVPGAVATPVEQPLGERHRQGETAGARGDEAGQRGEGPVVAGEAVRGLRDDADGAHRDDAGAAPLP